LENNRRRTLMVYNYYAVVWENLTNLQLSNGCFGIHDLNSFLFQNVG